MIYSGSLVPQNPNNKNSYSDSWAFVSVLFGPVPITLYDGHSWQFYSCIQRNPIRAFAAIFWN